MSLYIVCRLQFIEVARAGGIHDDSDKQPLAVSHEEPILYARSESSGLAEFEFQQEF